jgi:3-phenylpropionate/cinnamic acid dioxygenase small subunit
VDVTALAARLERLETAEAARASLYRYAEGADTRDWELLGSAFSPDAVMLLGDQEIVGRTAIVDALRGMLPPEFVTRHLMVNPQVTWTAPGEATITSTVYYLHDGSGFEATGWGSYRDTVQVVDGTGLITRKEFTPAQHLKGNAATLSARIGALEDAELARAATWRYATAIDDVDFDALADVFTEDAVLTTRKGPRAGRDVVVDYYRTALADPVERRHFLMNQDVTPVAPGEVMVTSYFIYTFAGAETSIVGWGTYVDRVRIEDGVGRIAEKTISIGVHADSRVGWAGEVTA